MPAADTYVDSLVAFAGGDLEATALPLAEPPFWEEIIRRAVLPGRTSLRRPNVWSASNSLLERSLSADARRARKQAAVSSLCHRNHRIRRRAIEVLAAASLDDSELQAVTHVALHDDDTEVQIAAVRLLAAHPESRAAVAALLDILRHCSDVRVAIACDALVALGDGGVEGLNALLDDPNSDVRWRAARCLAHLDNAAALPGLLRALHDDSADVAWVAADGLLALGPMAGVEVLKSVLNQKLSQVTLRALRHYAEQATPQSIFRPVFEGTSRSATGVGALIAADTALRKLSADGVRAASPGAGPGKNGLNQRRAGAAAVSRNSGQR